MIHKYKIVVMIAEKKNITKAAKLLNMSQPAVSHALKSLEEEWGFSIFSRTPSGVKLTENGRSIISLCYDILNLDEHLNQEINLISNVKSGKIKIGTFPSVTTKWIPQLLKIISQRHPGIEVTLLEENYETIQELVLNGELDCGFVSDDNLYESLLFTPIKSDPFLCLVNREDSLAKLDKIPLELLNTKSFILPGKGGAIELNKFFEKNNITPNIKYEIMDINQSIVAMIENNLGISILPQLILNGTSKNVLFKELEVDFKRTIGLISSQKPSPATKIFINLATESFGDFK